LCIKLPRFRRILAAVLLAHLLAVIAMAGSPVLHNWVHTTAHDSDHGCAVVLFNSGGADAPATVILIIDLLVKVGTQAEPDCKQIETVFRVWRILEHAPPATA